jgi:NDP-sugar pyrophosphorylase family protein/thiamine kinase-like enzyme
MNNAPKKAILLAAGFGSRMAPLSHDIPKPLMPLWGKPLLEHAIELLISWGVEDILINVHHEPGSVVKYCKNHTFKSCRIQLSFEPEILGTGGALKRANWFLGDKPFWMMNTDIAAEIDPSPLLKAFRKEKALAALWMHPALGPRTVEIRDQLITNFASSVPGSDETYTFCGLQLLSPRILKYLPKTKFCSVVDGYRNALKKGEPVLGITADNSFWADLGTRERYLQAHSDIREAVRKRKPGRRLLSPAQLKIMLGHVPAGVTVNGFAAVGENVSFGKNTQLRNCVIWDDVIIAKDSVIGESIIANNVRLRDRIELSSAVKCSVIPSTDTILALSLKSLRASADNTTLIELPGRGSNRSFQRIQSEKRSAILIRYDDQSRPENARYASHTKLLRSYGINVPKVLLDMPQHKATLFQDAGTISLESIAAELSSAELVSVYKKVISQLVRLHGITSKALRGTELEPPFSAELYAWERELFSTHFLRGYLKLSKANVRVINLELSQLAKILQSAPQVLLHRDMQSSNILLKNGRPMIIDFQGMRLGAAAYDAASLLCDPYVMLNHDQQEVLLEYFRQQTGNHKNMDVAVYTAAAIQRLTQALGAFGRLSQIQGMQHFEKHIVPACSMLSRVLQNTDRLPELAGLMESCTMLQDAVICEA